jgi:hypothetical protein
MFFTIGVKIQVLRDVTPRRFVNRCRRFEGVMILRNDSNYLLIGTHNKAGTLPFSVARLLESQIS